MKMTSSVWLAAALVLTGSHSALAQQHAHAAVSADCEQCRNGATCEDPGCCLCRVRLYPDAGWNPPVNLPVNHNWAWYGLSAPHAPYGSPNGGFIGQYPSVYQPTDTTQLGYYYHKVPTWQSQPGRLPAPPVPSHFHSRMCPTNCYGGHFHGAHHHGTVMHSYAVPTLPQPVQTAATFAADSEASPVSAPAPLKAVRSVSSTPEPQPSKASTAAKKPEVTARPVSRTESSGAPKPATRTTPKTAPKSSEKRPASSLLKSLFD
jgi:hypothetical protein